MAKVILPLMSEAARGKFGGSIFNQWRSIQYAKRWASPTQPRTPAQLDRRAALTTYTRLWATLTQAQRDSWTQYAEQHLRTDWTGKPLRITGQNAYISCNTRLSLLQQTPISDPPIVSAPGQIDTLVINQNTGAGNNITISWSDPTSGDETIVVWGEGPISFGRQPTKVRSTIIGTFEGDALTPEELIAKPSLGRYGFWVEVWDNNTGLVGPPTYVRFDAAAYVAPGND